METLPVYASDQLKVLVVDDDVLTGELLCLQLEQLGCVARHVELGSAALEILEGEEVHLLISDWQMPQMDGLELVREARARTSLDSHLHIALITARHDEAVIRRALEAGVDDFIYKPLAPVELELAVATARRNGLLHRRLRRRATLLTRAHERVREALRRVQDDIDAAARLHERLLPDRTQFGAIRIGAIYQPALSLGGDTLGVCEVPGGVLFFVIDVMGHGVPAALTSYHLHQRLKQLAPSDPASLERAVDTINRELSDTADEAYATLLCGLAQAGSNQLSLICAGHPPPLIVHDGVAAEVALTGSTPLGMFADATFQVEPLALPNRARLALYSDGLTDVLPDAAFAALLVEETPSSVEQLIARMDMAVGARQTEQQIDDDISLLVIERWLEESEG